MPSANCRMPNKNQVNLRLFHSALGTRHLEFGIYWTLSVSR